MSKRTYKQIECADCHRGTSAPNKLTKYCALCRLARGVLWHDGRTAKCRNCGSGYVAWAGTRRNRLCGTCFMLAAQQGERDSVLGKCAAKPHAEERWLYSADLAICYPCLHDPAQADIIRRTVTKKYRDLKGEA